MLEKNSIIKDRYEILKKVGDGGMSSVYLAMDCVLRKMWAIKEVEKKQSTAQEVANLEAVRHEIEIMRRLDHPYLPRITDVVEDEKTILIVMDYLEGEPLNRVLKRMGPQDQEQVIEWSKHICEALSYLHSMGIVYRDMKPSNLMLNNGQVRIFDFGIAREYKAGKVEDTTILGTHGYAAPEQYDADYRRQTDARTDVYNLGATMYKLLTGETPNTPRPIRQLNPYLREGLEIIVDKAMKHDMDERYQSAEEMLSALDRIDELEKPFRKKIRLFVTSLVLFASMAVVGTVSVLMMNHENNKNYDKLIGISTATEYDKKTESYEEAIELIGDDPRAYINLLQAYDDNGMFGDEESKKFSSLYNEHKDTFDRKDLDVIDLDFRIGYLYFNLFSGSDNTTRTRMLKARPYFKNVYESGRKDYKKYKLAHSFYILCDFYNKYVASSGVNEPSRRDYEELLESVRVCISNLNDYESSESGYIKLTMYESMLDLINEHARGMAKSDIPIDDIKDIMQTVYEKTEELSVTQKKSTDLQNRILESYAEKEESVSIVYENVRERS